MVTHGLRLLVQRQKLVLCVAQQKEMPKDMTGRLLLVLNPKHVKLADYLKEKKMGTNGQMPHVPPQRNVRLVERLKGLN